MTEKDKKDLLNIWENTISGSFLKTLNKDELLGYRTGITLGTTRIGKNYLPKEIYTELKKLTEEGKI